MKRHSGQLYNGLEQRESRCGIAWKSLVVVLLLAGSSCQRDVEYLEPATDSSFEPGQVWAYRTRPGEEGSLFAVGTVDRAGTMGRVVHITVTGVRVKSPRVASGIARRIAHLAVQEDALLESVTKQVDGAEVDRSGFQRSYHDWLDAYETGALFVQEVPLAEALDDIEASLNQ